VSDFAFRITNSSKDDLELHLEPWGEKYNMTPGAVFKVQATGPDNDILEIESTKGKIVVYGWPGSVVTVSPVE